MMVWQMNYVLINRVNRRCVEDFGFSGGLIFQRLDVELRMLYQA